VLPHRPPGVRRSGRSLAPLQPLYGVGPRAAPGCAALLDNSGSILSWRAKRACAALGGEGGPVGKLGDRTGCDDGGTGPSHARRAGLKYPIGTGNARSRRYILGHDSDKSAGPGRRSGLPAEGNETMTIFHRVAGAYVLTATVVGLLAMVV